MKYLRGRYHFFLLIIHDKLMKGYYSYRDIRLFALDIKSLYREIQARY